MIDRCKKGREDGGFSLVESLVAIAILASLSLFFFFFSNLNRVRVDSTLQSSCEQLARSSMDNLRAIGFEKAVAAGNVDGNLIEAGGAPNVVKPEHLWPDRSSQNGQIPLLRKTGDKFELNNHRTIIGSMSVLTAIYNSNPDFCSNPLGLNYTGGSAKLLLDTADQSLKNVSSSIRIERYNPLTGEKDCPSAPVFIRPPGEVKDDPALDALVNRPPNVTDEHGFWVTVTTEYTDPAQERRSCRLSSIFQYPKVRIPDQVTMVSADFDYTGDSPGACSAGMPEGTLTLVAPADFDTTHGIVILCRDSSSYQALQSGNPPGPLCPGEAGASTSIVAFSTWEDCSRVTVCGLTPERSQWSRPSGAPATLRNIYRNIPWGCSVRVEVRLIDPALNTTVNPAVAAAPPADSGFRRCMECPAGWTSSAAGYCPPTSMTSVCTPPSSSGDSGSGSPGGGDPGGPGGGDGGGSGDGAPHDGDDGGGAGNDGDDGGGY